MNIMGKVKHIPPSRKRYEETHPVIAIRVDKALYDKVKDIKEANDISFADILKQGLGMQKAEAESAFSKGRDAGQREGRKFELGICDICKKPLYWDLNREGDRQLLERAVNKMRYFHMNCKKQ